MFCHAGIPFSRLLLGPETEVQLSDLAGNAMSVPVVCATMLAAICAPELRRQREKSRKVLLTNFALSQEYDEAHGAVLAQRGDLYNQNKDYNAKGFVEIFADIAKTLAVDAFRSSALCTCETSGRTTEDTKILECTGCGMRVCHLCSGRCRVSSHSLKEIDVSSEENPRPDSHVFERKLRCAVPSILQFGENLEDYLENGKGLGSYSFQLQQVDRKSGFWLLVYGAWEDRGSGRQVAEIRVHIGKTTVLDTSVGVAAFIRCFAPAIRSDKPFRGKLKDSARLILKIDDCSEGMPLWQVPDKSTSVTLELVGSDLVDSQRVLAGLNDEAYKGLKAHKVQKSFQPPVDSRNNLLSYHKQWKTWPGTIAVSGDPLLSGTYKKCGCTHTVVLSALWRREDEGGPPMYLFYRPDVLRTKLDVAVFSPTPSYRDNMDVCELYDWIPENCLEKSAHKTKAKLLQWKPLPENLKIEVPSKSSMSMVAQSKSFHERVCASSHQNSGQVLCEMTGLSDELIASLLEYNDNAKAATLVELDLVGRSGTRNAKRLSIIAAPSLLKSAAEDRLPLKLSKWYKLKTPSSSGFGHCRNNVPLRPEEKWQISSGDKGKLVTVRFYDAQESKDYYFALMNRPKAFEVKVDKLKRTLSVEMNPYVAAHRAAVHLVNNDMGQVVDVDYQLAELSSMGEPLAKPFAVPNSDTYEETPVDLVHPLYKRQAKALTRMLAIENGDIPFAEEERSEIVLPGIGWCLIAKASKVSRLRGGVLGGKSEIVTTSILLCAMHLTHH